MTSLTHKDRGFRSGHGSLLITAAGIVALSGGCASQHMTPKELLQKPNQFLQSQHATPKELVQFAFVHDSKVKPEPGDPDVRPDGAMLARQWPESDAKWSNAVMVGWPMRFPYSEDISATQRPFPRSRAMDTFLFVYQTIALPFTYIAERPFQTVLWTSDVKIRPTYTAMPALPPSPQSKGADVESGITIVPISPVDVPVTEPSTAPATAPVGQ